MFPFVVIMSIIYTDVLATTPLSSPFCSFIGLNLIIVDILCFHSLSEPSLHHTKDITSLEAFCCVRPPHSSKSRTHSKVHPPPATSHTHKDFPSFQPTYIHFSQAIRLNSKPRPARPRSHMLATTGDLGPPGPFGTLGSFGPLAVRSHRTEMLSVIGKPCVLNCNQRPVTGLVRPQLHVFLPAEEETDSKSLDEGFMDESEAKMASLRLRNEDANRLADVPAGRADSVLGLLNH